jgi:hypothetical protein
LNKFVKKKEKLEKPINFWKTDLGWKTAKVETMNPDRLCSDRNRLYRRYGRIENRNNKSSSD